MKILILGESGMLGHVVKLYFKENGYTVKGTARKDGDYYYDVNNIKDIEKIISDYKPTHIINCIGILNKQAEDNKALAVLVNSYFPHYMDEYCKNNNIKFIHISTDCVFEGTKGKYDEESFKDATSFYGKSKALGEIENNINLTLRTSIIGPDINENGIGLFEWFMKQKEEVNGFKNVIWAGVTTVELAKDIELAIKNELVGLQHVTNNKGINKYDLLQLFKKHFDTNININEETNSISDKSIINKKSFDFNVPEYDKMIEDMGDWVENHQELYPTLKIRKK